MPLEMDAANQLILLQNIETVVECATSNWYNKFRSKGHHYTFRSFFIKAEDEFLKFLNADGVHLPRVPDSLKEDLSPLDPRFSSSNDDNGSWCDNEENEVSTSSDEQESSQFEFESLEIKINRVLEELGGSAFLKTNWSSVEDAKWVTGTLECKTAGDIFLLLKSSSLVQHDLSHSFDNCVGNAEDRQLPFEIVLKKYSSGLRASQEFRVFVVEKEIKCICQRRQRYFFDHLQNELEQKRISVLISNFYAGIVKHEISMSNFSIDVYLERTGKLWIVDFNPLPLFLETKQVEQTYSSQEFSQIKFKSDSIKEAPPHELVSWEDLKSFKDSPGIEFVVVLSQAQAENSKDVFSSHRVPLDLVNGDFGVGEVRELDEILDKLSFDCR